MTSLKKQFLLKASIRLPYKPAIAFLLYTQDTRVHMFTRMFIAPLFVGTQDEK